MNETPRRIEMQTVERIEARLDELERGHPGLWLTTRIEVHLRGQELVVFVTIPDDDPFEPERLNRIFDEIEGVIVPLVPSEIPLRTNGDAWTIMVHTPDHALIDGTNGGWGKPERTDRLSDGVGPPTR
jgi:hypothetical protein